LNLSRVSWLIFALFMFTYSCTLGVRKRPFIEEGLASYYALEAHGKRTASGERYDMYKLTAAHRTLPFGTLVKVTNLENGKTVVVRINDRGPGIKNRIMDLSFEAAKRLKMLKKGVARVRIEVLKWVKG